MAKVNLPTIPLDNAVVNFLKRIIDEGRPLNYIAAYTFDRATNNPDSITIKFYMDEQLSRFGDTTQVSLAKAVTERDYFARQRKENPDEFMF